MSGPFSTYMACKSSGPRLLRKLTEEHYQRACYSLKMDNLEDLVNVVTLRKKTTLVFIKKSPDEVAEILKAYPDLCSINVYRQKYWSPLPWNVTKNVRRSIFEQGFVTEKQVEYPKTD